MWGGSTVGRIDCGADRPVLFFLFKFICYRLKAALEENDKGKQQTCMATLIQR